MNSLYIILAIVVIGHFTGALEGLKSPAKLAGIVIAVLLFNEYYKKERFEDEATEEQKKFYF